MKRKNNLHNIDFHKRTEDEQQKTKCGDNSDRFRSKVQYAGLNVFANFSCNNNNVIYQGVIQ